MSTFINYLFAAGVAALVLSLPLGKWVPALRRLGIACVLLALVPAVVAEVSPTLLQPFAHDSTGSTWVGLMAAGAVLALMAWVFLKARSVVRGDRGRNRIAMMRPYNHTVGGDILEFVRRFRGEDRDG